MLKAGIAKPGQGSATLEVNTTHKIETAHHGGTFSELRFDLTTTSWTGAHVPEFPVELVGAGELYAAFLTESRTREPG